MSDLTELWGDFLDTEPKGGGAISTDDLKAAMDLLLQSAFMSPVSPNIVVSEKLGAELQALKAEHEHKKAQQAMGYMNTGSVSSFGGVQIYTSPQVPDGEMLLIDYVWKPPKMNIVFEPVKPQEKRDPWDLLYSE